MPLHTGLTLLLALASPPAFTPVAVSPCSALSFDSAALETGLDGGLLASGASVNAPSSGEKWLAASQRDASGTPRVTWLRLKVEASTARAGSVTVTKRDVAGTSLVEWAIGCDTTLTSGTEYLFAPAAGSGLASLSGRLDGVKLGPARELTVLMKTPGPHRLEMSARDSAGREFKAEWRFQVTAAGQ